MYVLDTNAARAGDVVGGFINETGKYVGKFTRAERLQSREKGTEGIGFTFKADDGRETRFDVWTMKQDGTALSGLNLINAMMTCLQLRELRPQVRKVKKYDFDQQRDIDATVPCFVELMDIEIGLLLRSEEYQKQNSNETGWRMGLFAVFQARTELMATEILGRKTSPEMLAQVVSALKDKPLRKKTPPQSSSLAAAGGYHDAFPADEDIPF